jgi:predicted nucleotidyltransferase
MVDLTADQLDTIRGALGFCFGADGAQVYLYGSRAKGTSWKYSDIDLAIDAPQPLDLLLADRIRRTISAAGIPYRVDIVDLNGRLSPIFRENVDRCKVLIFEGRHLLVQLPQPFEGQILDDAKAAKIPPQEWITKIVQAHYAL